MVTLVLAASDLFIATLAAPHTQDVRIGVYVPDEDGVFGLSGYLGVLDGSFSMDAKRNIRRQATMTLAPRNSLLDDEYVTTFDTRDHLEELTSQSCRLSIEWGLRFADATYEYVTLGMLRTEEFTRAALSGGVPVTAYDEGALVADYPIQLPFTPFDGVTALTVVECIEALITECYPTLAPPTFVVGAGVDVVSEPPANTLLTGDRWTGINTLAKPLGVVAYPSNDTIGEWNIVLNEVDPDPVWRVRSGDDGVLVDENTQASRREQYNGIAIRWHDPATDLDALVIVTDDDTASPTYWDGPFGKKPKPEYTLDTATTEDQVTAAATIDLAESSGQTRSVTFTAVHNPLIEANDVIGLWAPGEPGERHIVDSFTLPLLAGAMTGQTRILRGGATYGSSDVTYGDSGYDYEGLAT